MKFLRNLFSKTCTGKLFDTLQSLYYYIKDYNLISDTLYSEQFKTVLKRYLNLDVDKDWLGRLYGVINPNIDIDGHFDVTNMIIEIDGEHTNNNEHLKTWAYKQMRLIGQVFKLEQMWNYIDMQFEHVGPANHDNYLIIFDIASRKSFTSNLKRFLLHLSIYAIIGILCLVFLPL